MRVIEGERFCNRGHRVTLENTVRRINGAGRSFTACLECRRADRRVWVAKKRARRRANGLPANAHHSRRTDHVTAQIPATRLDEIRTAQGGKCAICKEARPLVPDHDHETLAVRGLLCQRCNCAIGLLYDDKDVIAAALAYLSDPPVRGLSIKRNPYKTSPQRRTA